jgi:hypothetical protein
MLNIFFISSKTKSIFKSFNQYSELAISFGPIIGSFLDNFRSASFSFLVLLIGLSALFRRLSLFFLVLHQFLLNILIFCLIFFENLLKNQNFRMNLLDF